ncbi:hypothetical protein DCC85_02705 [Paenibacillus sp. CAA11]|uniref:hypothetical protein n=1 Tax=Paenibacillus sp. CAA11 TaxID=1532905 RepID=UPI000D368572|nr:hypothetical protein [Paenibacillus sp. CAA11]AWB43247.1 hypothetical protein DCC85_02705 [Paenibacillus sp. CAA11]
MTELIQDAINLLQGELSPEAGIVLDISQEQLLPMAQMLQRSSITKTRQTRLLSLYLAIKFALLRHDCCQGSGMELTRSVLDGDYLYSFYMQLALKWGEYDLLQALARTVKQIQIHRTEGHPADELLLKGMKNFLQLEAERNHPTVQAI